jgi:serine/threonine protein kinase
MPEIGQTVSHYRITEKLGAGGMREVYPSEDTNLDLQVTIKVLPDIFSGDPERLARFEREAKLLASLHHPNIAAIHGFEEGGKRFLVMELVEGETLEQSIAKGPLPIDQALDVCRQIAEGLEAAHEKGVIHRDLKPASIKVTPEGKVKILDFGLAKAFQEETAVTDPSQSPTLTAAMSRAVVILGPAVRRCAKRNAGLCARVRETRRAKQVGVGRPQWPRREHRHGPGGSASPATLAGQHPSGVGASDGFRGASFPMTRRLMEASLTAKRQEYVGMPVWSRPDGKRLAYNVGTNEANTSGLRVGVYELGEKPGEGKIRSLPDIRPVASEPALSPNGDWIVYISYESNISQVYLSRYPSGETRRLSPTRGSGPLWSRDGKEVFYQRRRGAELWVVPVDPGAQLKIGEARKLFEGSYLMSTDSGRAYDVSPDGKRFLMVKTHPQDWSVSELVVVRNWFEELKRLVSSHPSKNRSRDDSLQGNPSTLCILFPVLHSLRAERLTQSLR